MLYLQGTESVPVIIFAHALGVDIRWRGCVHGRLFNDQGEIIGSYYEKSAGYSIWTDPYAGHAYRNELEIIPCVDSCSEIQVAA